jgi:hypothetical protein
LNHILQPPVLHLVLVQAGHYKFSFGSNIYFGISNLCSVKQANRTGDASFRQHLFVLRNPCRTVTFNYMNLLFSIREISFGVNLRFNSGVGHHNIRIFVVDAIKNFAIGGMSLINNTDWFVHFLNNKLHKKNKNILNSKIVNYFTTFDMQLKNMFFEGRIIKLLL